MTRTRTVTSRHRWTSADELALIRLYNEGKTFGEIAQALGMRRPQVKHRIMALRSEGRLERERVTSYVGRKLQKEPEGAPVYWKRGTYYVSPGRLIHRSYGREDMYGD